MPMTFIKCNFNQAWPIFVPLGFPPLIRQGCDMAVLLDKTGMAYARSI